MAEGEKELLKASADLFGGFHTLGNSNRLHKWMFSESESTHAL